MAPQTDLELVRERCLRVLERNWREGVRRSDGAAFAYTCPSPGHYPWQWFWDSCLHAIVWRRLDRERARRELCSLLRAQREDGFIGHTIFWDTPLRGLRRHTYNVCSPADEMTATIQPPMLAWAWSIAIGDPRAQPAILRHHRWLADNRDLEGDGLLWIISPDESGLDASPQFDPVWGARAHGLPGYLRLVHANRRLGFDARRVAAAGGTVCCEVTTNVAYGLSRLALGLPSITPALIERCWDERRGLFVPDARPAAKAPIPATVAALSPLALPDLPAAIGRRLVEEQLLCPHRFWTAAAPASVSLQEPGFSARERAPCGLRRYWRGPAWINLAWLCWLGLVRLGYEQPAAELARRAVAAIAASGLREYYHPHTRAGMGAEGFAWSALALEMADPAPPARAADADAGPGATASAGALLSGAWRQSAR
ncbi:MAG TPA: hypothetical protein VKV27_06240 [Solirubrobacteraceae bacterium]|nr:hypothetical protein [Solirubrobacteraceae bacterium]